MPDCPFLTQIAFVFCEKLFEAPFQTLPKDYEKALSKVEIKRDMRYSADEHHTFDAYYPKEAEETHDTYSVIFWVHGGGFAGGDKEITRVIR